MTDDTPAPRTRPSTVSAAAVLALQEGDNAWARYAGAIAWETIPPARAEFIIEHVTPVVAAEERAKLAEVRETVATFLAHHGSNDSASFQKVLALAHGVLQVLDRDKSSSEEGEDRG